MKEQEYIDVRDLQRIDSALVILRDVLPETSNVIEGNELREAVKILAKFRDRLYGEIQLLKES